MTLSIEFEGEGESTPHPYLVGLTIEDKEDVNERVDGVKAILETVSAPSTGCRKRRRRTTRKTRKSRSKTRKTAKRSFRA
jgi:hypothetical protein